MNTEFRPSAPSKPGLMALLTDPTEAVERLIHGVDQALRTITHSHQAAQTAPQPEPSKSDAAFDAPVLTPQEAALSAALMRVNHVGEVCAQALYSAQALATPDPALRAHFNAAAKEEVDHLVWTEQRLRSLGSHTSRLNPLWYAGAFGIGLLAGRLGDRTSLGFVIETERQVEEHLNSHLEQLPLNDHASRAIVRQMRDDEVRHAEQAHDAGGVVPPEPVRWLMRAAAKVMTTTAHHI